MLKFIWGIESLSRLVNIFYLLTVLILLFYAMTKKYISTVWTQYLLPGMAIVTGITINILVSAYSNSSVLAQFGSLIPWILFLLIPYHQRFKKVNINALWRYANNTMAIVILLGLLDYYTIYVVGSDGNYLDTPLGDFIGGKFSVLGTVEKGIAYHRFYALFSEPGTLAMLLIPFIIYSILKRYYWRLLIFGLGFILTFSLGGYVSLIIALITLYLWKSKNWIGSVIIVAIVSFFMNSLYSSDVIEIYNKKGNSATVREQNLFRSIKELPSLMLNHPLGLPLSNTTLDRENNADYVGSNFIPSNYFQSGGILSFLGYMCILFSSIRIAMRILFLSRECQSVESIVVAISIISALPFLMQRTTIWETPIFAFLFAPYLIDQFYKVKYV